MNLAGYVVAVLAAQGVRHVYGYPGASIIPLMDAVDLHPDVTWVLVRHEGAAALAASAHAKLTGELGVCMATAGPGATNLITGLVDAHVDRAPVLALTGVVPTWKQSRSGFQDIDGARLFAGCLSHSLACGHPDQLPILLRECVSHALQGRAAVHLAIPHDIQTVAVSPEDARFRTTEPLGSPAPEPAPLEWLEAAVPSLNAFSRKVIVVGGRAVGAGAAIEALAQRFKAPILSSMDAKGIIDESHPCSLGVLGVFGAPAVEMTLKILAEAEAILAFGVDDLAPFLVGQDGVQSRVLFQFEPDAGSVTHRYRSERVLCGPLEATARALAERVAVGSDGRLLADARQRKLAFAAAHSEEAAQTGGSFIHPVHFLRHLGRRLPEQSVVAFDVGDHTVWATQFLPLTKRQRVLVSKQFGVMGFALPALLAAKLARPEAHAFGICGDGGFQMVLGELATAVQYKAGFTLAVFENGVLQRVAAQQARPVGTRLHNPDFVAVARAMGAEGLVVDGDTDLDALFDKVFAPRETPLVLAVRLDPQVQAPMSSWSDGFTPLHFS
ncbi:MAG: thiamine pyrophosphate-binding protein [Planctomycetes bacterium]|nr:thiamine pyrophosphate-binding protein [Planctomycetota bacterium]